MMRKRGPPKNFVEPRAQEVIDETRTPRSSSSLSRGARARAWRESERLADEAARWYIAGVFRHGAGVRRGRH
jgi:hypothetical protein